MNLLERERRVFSQTGEDGVLEAIFETVIPGPKFAVDIGASDGVQNSNTRNLIVNHGWGALLIEADPSRARRCTENAVGLPVTVIQELALPRNAERLLEAHQAPHDLDLLSIDIDGNDYYIWEAIETFRPKVVLIEYNAGFSPPQRAIMPYDPDHQWDHTDYFGASLQSLADLGESKGYDLVYCESSGANAFFTDKRFGLGTGMSATDLYQEPKYGDSFGGRAPNGRGYPVSNRFG